jgi:hypothetical protein
VSISIAVAAAILIGCVCLRAGAANAHEWYPHECCNGDDCAPVDKVIRLTPAGTGDPRLIVTSRHGTAVVPGTLPSRESKDHRMHVCMRPSFYGGMGVVCLFMPPSMY